MKDVVVIGAGKIGSTVCSEHAPCQGARSRRQHCILPPMRACSGPRVHRGIRPSEALRFSRPVKLRVGAPSISLERAELKSDLEPRTG